MTAEILIIEDDKDVQKLLEFTFESEGYEVELCDTGADALTYLDNGATPSVVVLDLMLPGIDGMDVLKHRRESDRLTEIPVIVLTSVDRDEIIEDAFHLGADDFIGKPFSPDELQVRARRFLD